MRLRNRLRSGRLPRLIAIMGLWLALSAAPARADACSTGVSISASTAAFSPNYDFTDAVQHTTMVTTMRIVGVVNGCGYLVGAEGGGSGVAEPGAGVGVGAGAGGAFPSGFGAGIGAGADGAPGSTRKGPTMSNQQAQPSHIAAFEYLYPLVWGQLNTHAIVAACELGLPDRVRSATTHSRSFDRRCREEKKYPTRRHKGARARRPSPRRWTRVAGSFGRR